MLASLFSLSNEIAMAASSRIGGADVIGPWKIAILASTTEQPDSKPFTLYVISVHYTVPAELVSAGGESVIDWTVSRRYSEFEKLRSRLAELSTIVPTLPGKSWFGSMSADTVAARKAGLKTFLADCIQRPWITEMNEWKQFFEISSHVEPRQLYGWEAREIKVVRNIPVAGTSDTYGVNDLVYLPGPLVLLLGMEEQRLLQKVDNMVSQLRMPWGDKQKPLPRPLPLGTVRVMKVDGSTGGWKTMCSVATSAGVVCLAFEEHTRTLVAGLDDGTIHLYRVDAAWQELELKTELTGLHEPKTRVTAISIHRRKQYMFSASRDKHMSIYDLRKELLLSSTTVGAAINASAWVSAMELDEENDFAFLGTYSQHIHIYDVSSPVNPRLLHTLEGHTGSIRCLQFRPAERYLFSGGYEGWAGVWSIIHGATPESVTRSRSVGWLKEGANQKVKSVVFIPPTSGANAGGNNNGSQGLVVIGQDGGYMCFFNIAAGKMKYAIKAHTNTVVRLVYIEEAHVLISAGLDGVVKFWNIPVEATPGEDVKPMTNEAVSSGAVAASAASATSAASAAAATSGADANEIDDLAESMDAVGEGSFSGGGGLGSNSFNSQQQNDSESVARRKNSSLGPSAPPPSLASSSSILHKSSRADSTDGTMFNSSFTNSPSASSSIPPQSRTSFFRPEEYDLNSSSSFSSASAGATSPALAVATAAVMAPSASSSSNAGLFSDSPVFGARKASSENTDLPPFNMNASNNNNSVAVEQHENDHAAADSNSSGAVEVPSQAEEEDIF